MGLHVFRYQTLYLLSYIFLQNLNTVDRQPGTTGLRIMTAQFNLPIQKESLQSLHRSCRQNHLQCQTVPHEPSTRLLI